MVSTTDLLEKSRCLTKEKLTFPNYNDMLPNAPNAVCVCVCAYACACVCVCVCVCVYTPGSQLLLGRF